VKKIILPAAIDLHDFTVEQGYNRTLMFIKLKRLAKASYAKIITGRSGKMRNEFERWMKNPAFKDHVINAKPYDDNGSWLVKLKP
jgi:DNA-nicking Smr family endonuclease